MGPKFTVVPTELGIVFSSITYLGWGKNVSSTGVLFSC
jgi:hypothetical protein